MSIDVVKERQRLTQEAFQKWIFRDIRPTEMVTVYLSDHKDTHHNSVYCALIPNSRIERSLSDFSWDLSCGDGLPSSVVYHSMGEETLEYLRYGSCDGVEPLIICRYFDGIRENYYEISEEFRLFHRLYHDRKQDKYIKIDDSGTEHDVVIVEPGQIQIRLQEIRQFLAIKDMHLAVMFDCSQHSSLCLTDLGIKEKSSDYHAELSSFMLHYGDLGGISGDRTFTRLLGKRLFPPFPKEKSGLWGFAEEKKKKHVEFIINVDDDGNEVINTSNPSMLSNSFGSNPGEPPYLTPVHFRRQVLDKYYQQPAKYSVGDGSLGCGSLWGMTMDNHHDDRVVAWLGDLGRDLPYEEQLHWRSHNIPPAGGVSKTFYTRQILAQFADSDHPEHVFKYRYTDLAKTCKSGMGWLILLPLSKEDDHYFAVVRVPATDEQKDFDDLILGLTKILVDSLNEKELNKFIPTEERGEIKGSISRLEKVIICLGVQEYEGHIKFLRDLQNLRSCSTAHRKGSNYQKIAEELGINSQSLRTVFEGILTKGLLYLEFLEELAKSGAFIRKAKVT